MSWVRQTLQSSIGCKFLMAVTGLALVGFLIAHLAGNLLIFAGPQALNAYSKGLHTYEGILWVLRLGLIAAFFSHVFAAIRLSILNKKARPVDYKNKQHLTEKSSSRYMTLTGLLLLAFVIYHLAHLTFRLTHDDFLLLGEYQVYEMLVLSFSNPLLSLSYCACIVLLMFHLNHGIASLFQSLGIYHSKYNGLIKNAGSALCILLAAGFISIPVAVLVGIIH